MLSLSKKKFFVIVICATLSTFMLCSSFLLANVQAQESISPLPDVSDELLDTELDTNITPDAPTISGPANNDPFLDEKDIYLSEIKDYRNGYMAYAGAVKYLEMCDSYQINSSGYLNVNLLGQNVSIVINFKTIKQEKTFYNVLSMNSNIVNANIQSKSNASKIAYRVNESKTLDKFPDWKKDDATADFAIFNRDIILDEVSEENANVSGFRKTNDGYKFTVSMSHIPLVDSIGNLLQNVANVDIELNFKSASTSFILNEYGAPITATYTFNGTAVFKGIAVSASISLVDRFGNFNKDIEIDDYTFGNYKESLD